MVKDSDYINLLMIKGVEIHLFFLNFFLKIKIKLQLDLKKNYIDFYFYAEKIYCNRYKY